MKESDPRFSRITFAICDRLLFCFREKLRNIFPNIFAKKKFFFSEKKYFFSRKYGKKSDLSGSIFEFSKISEISKKLDFSRKNWIFGLYYSFVGLYYRFAGLYYSFAGLYYSLSASIIGLVGNPALSDYLRKLFAILKTHA